MSPQVMRLTTSVLRVIEDPTANEKTNKEQRNEIVIKRIHKAPSVLSCYKRNHPLKLLTGNLKQQIKGEPGEMEIGMFIAMRIDRKSIRSTKPERRYINV